MYANGPQICLMRLLINLRIFLHESYLKERTVEQNILPVDENKRLRLHRAAHEANALL